jgi:hypothetical protein
VVYEVVIFGLIERVVEFGLLEGDGLDAQLYVLFVQEVVLKVGDLALDSVEMRVFWLLF